MDCLPTYAKMHTLSMTFRVLHGWLYVVSCVPFCPSCPRLQSYYLEDSMVPSALPVMSFCTGQSLGLEYTSPALNVVASFSTFLQGQLL